MGRARVRKALSEIGFDQYYQAEQTGWVLYLEGSTDLAILQAFARRLGKDNAVRALERPFVRYVGNSPPPPPPPPPPTAAHHFHGLREAIPGLKGVALFDRLDLGAPDDPFLRHLVWHRREIENYLCTRNTLEAYARATAAVAEPRPLFARLEVDDRLAAMDGAIGEVSGALETLGKGSPWGADLKVSDEFLTPLFRAYFRGDRPTQPDEQEELLRTRRLRSGGRDRSGNRREARRDRRGRGGARGQRERGSVGT